MKQKKNSGAKKVLLMGISCALVAALSVSITLAYLTAKTNEKDNKFKASGGITGEVIEPSYDITMANSWKPGDTIPKNPMVDNDTTQYDVWVGASIQYQISVDGGSNYRTVSYDTFKEYVTVTGKAGTHWAPMTASGVTGDADLKDYYFYNTLLLKQGTETPAETAYNGTTAFGSTGNVTTDNTTELFTSVMPKAGLDINPKYKTNPTAAELKEGYSKPMSGKTLITSNGALPASDIDLSTLAFNSFKFKIKIVGYGVKDDATITSTGGVINTGSDSYTNVTDAILKGLGGKASS